MTGQHTLTAQTTVELDGDTFAVCVVDPHNRLAPDGCFAWLPPAWLIEARDGTCQTCKSKRGWSGYVRTSDMEPIPCRHCIDGRTAVEVQEMCQACAAPDVCSGEDADGDPCPDCRGKVFGSLGSGTVEHVLPVYDHNWLMDNGLPERWQWHIDTEDGLCIPDRRNGWDVTPLDITVTPGQYVVLVRMEDA